jgi:mannan endo-1,4-beta-mannosidase
VNPAATTAAQELLKYLYSLPGRAILSGQHNQMARMSTISDRVKDITGKYPAMWGGEWGFSDERHDTDNVKYRPRFLDQIREHHAAGRVICVTYHQASPTVGEPCEFEGGVICNISEADWDDILTDQTPLNRVWAAHVDRLAEALKSVIEVPIVFRPYHEMNGSWFWWGGEPERFKALWAMTYDRFVHRHKLHNLLWAWTCDRPWEGLEAYYPGHDTVDILGTDIYPAQDRPETYPQEWWDRMARIAEGRPIGLSEISELPTKEVFKRQPYAWFMGWDGLIFSANSEEHLCEIYHWPHVISDHAEYRN